MRAANGDAEEIQRCYAVVDILHIPASLIGIIQSGDTAGNIVGGLSLAVLASRIKPRPLIAAGMILLGAVIASIALTSRVTELVIVYFVFGMLTVALQAGIGALMQINVDNTLMGRFMSLMSIIPSTVSVCALAFSGAVGAALGIRNFFVVAGLILAIAGGSTWLLLRKSTKTAAV